MAISDTLKALFELFWPTRCAASDALVSTSPTTVCACCLDAIDKKAIEPVIIDVRGKCDYADFLVVCSGRSDRHVDGIATGIDTDVVDMRQCISNEGLANGQWVLLDYADVVVHVFNGHKRNEYDIAG